MVQKRRNAGLWTLLIGLVILLIVVAAPGPVLGIGASPFVTVGAVVGIGLSVSGLLSVILPRMPLEKKLEEFEEMKREIEALKRELRR